MFGLQSIERQSVTLRKRMVPFKRSNTFFRTLAAFLTSNFLSSSTSQVEKRKRFFTTGIREDTRLVGLGMRWLAAIRSELFLLESMESNVEKWGTLTNTSMEDVCHRNQLPTWYFIAAQEFMQTYSLLTLCCIAVTIVYVWPKFRF